MESSEVVGITFCLLLILSVAGCTDSSKSPHEVVSTENTSITNQPTQSPTTGQSTPVSTDKESKLLTTNQNKESPVAGENLTVHFLDVGQGDSILVEYNNRSMLIDAGESDQGKLSQITCIIREYPH